MTIAKMSPVLTLYYPKIRSPEVILRGNKLPYPHPFKTAYQWKLETPGCRLSMTFTMEKLPLKMQHHGMGAVA